MSPASAPDFEALRAREFGRLDRAGAAYLDFTGAALYPESLIRRDARRLQTAVRGNPHSMNPAAAASTAAVQRARAEVLRHFEADPAEYEVVFTHNASGAMRIIAESFPFATGSRLVLTADNHNSMNGLAPAARARGATVDYVPLDGSLRPHDPLPLLPRTRAPSLFAYPAQSNFSGAQHPLRWVGSARERGYTVLLDAAAYAPTSRLRLSEVAADFTAVSFYKMFGYPTGIGALIARRQSLSLLRRRFFAGGTVQFVSLQNRLVRLKPDAEAFEDGTPSFLAMDAVTDGLRWLRRIGRSHVRRHVQDMTRELLQRLHALGDSIRVYGPTGTHARGNTVAFNVIRDDHVVPYEDVEELAARAGVCIRGGCFCNPGAAERAFGFEPERTRRCLSGPFSIPRLRACLDGSPVGAVRASVGIPTSTADLDALVAVLRTLRDARGIRTSTQGSDLRPVTPIP